MKAITKTTELYSNKPINIVHMPGTVIQIMFWASYSPPCHMHMTNNEVIMIKNRATWGKSVRIIGLSIDKTSNEARKHMLSKRWQANE